MTSAEFLIDNIGEIIEQDLLEYRDKWGGYHCPVSKGYDIIKNVLEEVHEVAKSEENTIFHYTIKKIEHPNLNYDSVILSYHSGGLIHCKIYYFD